MQEIRPEDDLFHPRDDNPYWNESAWFTFMIPERKIDGWIYLWHRPNMKLSAGGLAMWDPTGEYEHDALFYDIDEHLALPDGAEMHDVSLDNSLTVECLEPLKSHHFSFDRNGCKADLRFDAISEAMHPARPSTEGWVASVSEFPNGHYDQIGRTSGSLVVDGEHFEIDSWSIRDRSWGPRLPGGATCGSYLWGVASERDYFGVIALRDHTLAEDPIEGTTEPVMGGFFAQDGVVGVLVAGERQVMKRGGDGRPLIERIHATDSLGRVLEAEGEMQNFFHWPCYGSWYIGASLASWRFAGKSGWGESLEYFPLRTGRPYHRSLPVEARLPGAEILRRTGR